VLHRDRRWLSQLMDVVAMQRVWSGCSSLSAWQKGRQQLPVIIIGQTVRLSQIMQETDCITEGETGAQGAHLNRTHITGWGGLNIMQSPHPETSEFNAFLNDEISQMHCLRNCQPIVKRRFHLVPLSVSNVFSLSLFLPPSLLHTHVTWAPKHCHLSCSFISSADTVHGRTCHPLSIIFLVGIWVCHLSCNALSFFRCLVSASGLGISIFIHFLNIILHAQEYNGTRSCSRRSANQMNKNLQPNVFSQNVLRSRVEFESRPSRQLGLGLGYLGALLPV